MTVSILCLLLLLWSGAAFEYKADGTWYLPVEQEGRLDVYGIEAVRLRSTELGAAECVDRDAPSLALWAAGVKGCQQLLQHSLELQCVPHHYPTRLMPVLGFQCAPLSLIPYYSLYLEMSCSSYQYPTNKIKDARTCRFALELTSALPALELCFHLFSAIFTSFELIAFVAHLVRKRRVTLRLLITTLAVNGAYLVIVPLCFFFHAALLSALLLGVWAIALSLQLVYVVRLGRFSKRQ